MEYDHSPSSKRRDQIASLSNRLRTLKQEQVDAEHTLVKHEDDEDEEAESDKGEDAVMRKSVTALWTELDAFHLPHNIH